MLTSLLCSGFLHCLFLIGRELGAIDIDELGTFLSMTFRACGYMERMGEGFGDVNSRQSRMTMGDTIASMR